MDTVLFLMWLHLKQSLSPAKAVFLLKELGTAENVYRADKNQYMELGITNPVMLRSLMDKDLSGAKQEVHKATKLSMTLLGYGTENYPSILYELPDPPVMLYVWGDTKVLHNRNAFCMVGARHSTVYGMSATLGVSEQLARCGMVIVSGVAMGIDSAAHRGAVRGRGKTIGIMGCGLNVAYPAENGDVRRAIIENGALISEFPLDTPPLPSNFPIRNRLLSGFSLGVAVMEAGEKSGALITAKYAAEQGRDVYALPGNISNPMSAGTNRLIQDGASVLLSADAVLAEYIMRYPTYFSLDEVLEEKDEATENNWAEKTEGLQSMGNSQKEKRILQALGKEALHPNEISRLLKMPIGEVQSSLTMLQIKGKIKEHPGNRFSV